jgi:7-keto-8-aminopelargonate synthetase-like enzyme
MHDEPELVKQLTKNAEFMRAGFSRLGFDTGQSESPIIPIIIGDDALTFKVWRELFDNGVFVNPVISPATAPGRQLLRTSYMATHTEPQLVKVLEVFEKVGRENGLI